MVTLGKYSINSVFRGNGMSDLCDLAEVYSFVDGLVWCCCKKVDGLVCVCVCLPSISSVRRLPPMRSS